MKCQPIVGSTKLHFHLFIQQFWYKFLSFLAPFFIGTHHWIWTCLKFAHCSSFTTSLFVFSIHTRYNSRFASLTGMKSPRPKSWNGVSTYVFNDGHMFLGPQYGVIIGLLGSTSIMGGMAPGTWLNLQLLGG